MRQYANADQLDLFGLGMDGQEACMRSCAAGLRMARDLRTASLGNPSAGAVQVVAHPGHDGAPPRAIDVDLDEMMGRDVTRRVQRVAERHGMPGARVVVLSEEGQASFALQPGIFIVVLDPLDGTSPLLQRGEGYAVAAQLFWVDPDSGPVPIAGAIAASCGQVVSWGHLPGAVARVRSQTLLLDRPIDDDHTPGQETDPDRWRFVRLRRRPESETIVVASVAASGSRRLRLLRETSLWSDERVVLHTGAGNPVLEPLLSMETDAVVELAPPRPRDALFLIAAQMVGFVVTTPAGDPIDVTAEVTRLVADQRGRFPAYVVAHPDVHARVLGLLTPAGSLALGAAA